jgi:hypothetical protein
MAYDWWSNLFNPSGGTSQKTPYDPNTASGRSYDATTGKWNAVAAGQHPQMVFYGGQLYLNGQPIPNSIGGKILGEDYGTQAGPSFGNLYNTPAGPENPNTALGNYTAPSGSMMQALMNWFQGGPDAFRVQPGVEQSTLQKLLGKGPSAFTSQMGSAGEQLLKLFGQGPGAFTTQPGRSENALFDLFGKGPGAFTAQAGPAENALLKMLMGGPGAFTPGAGPLESKIAGMTPGSLTPPASAGENELLGLIHQPFLQSVSEGKVPPGIMAQFKDQQAASDAQIREQMGTAGQSYGTGLAGTLAQANNTALNTLMAGTEHDALAAIGLQRDLASGAGQLANQRATAALSAYTSLTAAGVSAETAREIAGLNAYTSIGQGVMNAETSRGIAGMNLYGNVGQGLMNTEAQRGMTGMNLFGNIGQSLMGQQNQLGQQGMQNYLNTGQYLTGLEGQQGQDAMNKLFGLGQGLMGQQQQGLESGMQRLFQDYGQASGLPPELQALIQTAGMGEKSGSSTTKSGPAGGGGFDWASMAQTLAMLAMHFL